MSKNSRKRTHEDEVETSIPKQKYRSYDEIAQAEDEQLHKILFGGSSSFLQRLDEAEKEDLQAQPDSGLGESDSDNKTKHVPAWSDSDDDIDVGEALDSQGRRLPEGGINDRSNKYKNLLRHKFESIHGNPKWARLDRSGEDSDEDDEILQTCGFTKKQQSLYLPRSVLKFKKLKDLNCDTYNEGPHINAIEFLQESTVALVAGQSGKATLYSINGKENVKLHSINIQNFPIFSAKVMENNNEIFFGSRHPFIHSFDLITSKSIRVSLPPGLTTCKKCSVSSDQNLLAVAGKWGEIHLLSARTKERIGVLKQNSEVTALTFGFGNDLLYAHSESGEITLFDVNMRRVKHKFMDEGCLQGTTLAVSPSNRFLAAGSAQGVVNIYDTNSIYKNEPTPEKALMNLRTKISALAFNSTSEMLAYASAAIPNSVKMYHLGSHTNFKNFPSRQSFRNVNVLGFSPNSGYVAFGDDKHTVSLFRLNHFNNY